MCKDCGCNQPSATHIHPDPNQAHDHGHHHHHHHHDHDHQLSDYHALSDEEARARVLEKNRHIAVHNREHLDEMGVFCINLISAPGSGKTALLERMLSNWFDGQAAVIEGDLETQNDAERIRKTGVPAVQVNTGQGCHLDAGMIHDALHHMKVPQDGLLIIENVGNMVCPADFDLGEHHKIAMISCTEGEDKPSKYPGLIEASSVLIINKTDLLPHLDFDVARCRQLALELNPELVIFELSATTGEGVDGFASWLQEMKPGVAAAG